MNPALNQDSVIEFDRLSKRYRLGVSSPQGTLRDAIIGRLSGIADRFLRGRRPKESQSEEFWALKDVSFKIGRGEVVGVIGRNGAGKSTLLKICSRITEPSSGRITIRGRVASLLEVGTGFHPELTGRENIFLNGVILGMKRAEIRRKFDQIVEFAEVGRFLDTPVKHYSSGMHVRLAFAVAAHLEPEILIIDEVLAVGDTAFQRKCLGKIQDIARDSNRTVLFVSHDMSAISSLTNRCALLDKGRLLMFDTTPKVIAAYLASVRTAGDYINPNLGSRPDIATVRVVTSEGNSVQVAGLPMRVEIELHHPEAIPGACVSIQLINQFSHPATHLWLYACEQAYAGKPGRTMLACEIPRVRLNVGSYFIRVFFSEPPGGRFFGVLDSVCPFEVVRLEDSKYWGWRPDACIYHEDATWTIHERSA